MVAGDRPELHAGRGGTGREVDPGGTVVMWLGDATAERIDAGVRAILDAAFDWALESLRKNRAVPDACAAAFLAKQVVGVYWFPFSRPTPVTVAMLTRGYFCST